LKEEQNNRMNNRTLIEKVEGRLARLNAAYAVAERLGMDKQKIVRRCQALTQAWREARDQAEGSGQ
jgi:hypothetical protein